MKDARSSIESLLNEMKPLLLVAGVPSHQINLREGRHKIPTCNTAFDWLHVLFLSPEFIKLEYAWALLPEVIWKRYEILDIIETKEQVILESAKKEVLKLWKKKRPRVFGRNKKVISFTDNTCFESCKA